MAVAIVTDSASSLPAGLAADREITVVPMVVLIDGVATHDGELPLEEVVERSARGLSTSGPSPGEFRDAIARRMGPDGVLVLTVARTMSGTYDAACVGAELSSRTRGEGDAPVRVVDTGTAAGAQALVVLAAARRAAAGVDIDEVEATALHVASKARLVATLDDLSHLVRSGRVPGIAGWAGRKLRVNPLFEFAAGRVALLRPAFGEDAALERIVSRFLLSRGADVHARAHVAALHALAPVRAARLLDLVREEVEPATALLTSFGPVMIAHTGPGVAGLAWWWEPSSR